LLLVAAALPLNAITKNSLLKVEVVKVTIDFVSLTSIKIGVREIFIRDDNVLKLNGKQATINDLKVGNSVIAMCKSFDNKVVARSILVFSDLSITRHLLLWAKYHL